MNPLFLVALVLAFGWEEPPVVAAGPWGMTAAGIVPGLAWLLSAGAVGLACHRMGTRAGSLAGTVAWYQRFALALRGFNLATFAVAVIVLGWGYHLRRELGLADVPLLPGLLTLLPYLAAELIGLAGSFRVGRSTRELVAERAPRLDPRLVGVRPTWNLRQFLVFQFRVQFGALLAGASLLTLWNGLLAAIVPKGWLPSTVDSVVFGVTSWVGFLLLAPFLLRIVLGAVAFPDGPSRRFLERVAHEVGFRYRELLLWPTHRALANAAVSGVLPQVRYILFSDALLERLAPDELAAVFGHEIGHVKHRHMPFYAFFLAAGIIVVLALTDTLTLSLFYAARWALPPDSVDTRIFGWIDLGLLVVLMGAFFFLGFGSLSRCFERQADLYGCRVASRLAPPSRDDTAERDDAAAGADAGLPGFPDFEPAASEDAGSTLPSVQPHGVEAFLRALEKVGVANDARRQGWSWRHGSIIERIGFLEAVQQGPELAVRFERRVRWVRWGWTAILTVGLAAALAQGVFLWGG